MLHPRGSVRIYVLNRRRNERVDNGDRSGAKAMILSSMIFHFCLAVLRSSARQIILELRGSRAKGKAINRIVFERRAFSRPG